MRGYLRRRVCCGLAAVSYFLPTSSLPTSVPDIEADGPADERLKRPQFGMHRITWPDDEDGSVEFHLAHGDWIRLLYASGFQVEDLLEVYVSKDATTSYQWTNAEWAHRWPCEEVWKARKSR
jgi:hypothetical protein